MLRNIRGPDRENRMKTNKIVVMLLILVIMLSLVTITFSTMSMNKTVNYSKQNAGDRGTISLVIEGDEGPEAGNIGLTIEGGE